VIGLELNYDLLQFSVDPDDLPPQGVSEMEGGAVCLNCGKTFKHLGNANRHFKEKHLAVPGKKFDCHICGKSFSLARMRNEHRSKVHNIKKLKGKVKIPQVKAEEEE